MDTHVVVGAGAIGHATAGHLARAGHQVVLASRSGTDPGIEGVRTARVDATDAAALARLAAGASSLVNATNPPHYHRWATEWPPVADAFLTTAEGSGAVLVTVSNLYGYGPVAAPMSEDAPMAATGTKGRVRSRMWHDALAAHRTGRLRATELRASDYFGPGVAKGVSVLNDYVVAAAAAGRTVRLPVGVPDAPHSWTYADDIGALAARLAADERAWGKAWHVPTGEPRTMRQVAGDAARLAGRDAPPVKQLPAMVKLLARVLPVVRELDETSHQFERPFVIDDGAARTTFGLVPTPWETALAATVDSLLGRDQPHVQV